MAEKTHPARVCSHCAAEHRKPRRKLGHSWCKAKPSKRYGLDFPVGRGCSMFKERGRNRTK